MDQNESNWIKQHQTASMDQKTYRYKDKKDIKWVYQKKKKIQRMKKYFKKDGSKKNEPVSQKHPIVRLEEKNFD